MILRRLFVPVLAALLGATAAAAAEPPPAAGDAGAYDAVLERLDALVRVEVVLKVQLQGNDQEIETEAGCLMVDPAGLVLCSHHEMGGYLSMMGRAAGMEGFNVNPTAIEVFAGDGEGLAARLLTRDTDRDLAWLAIDEPGEGPFAAVDLAAGGAELAPGDRFYVLRRMDGYFGRTPMVIESMVGAVPERPRRLYAPQTPINAGFGLPAFTADGTFVGVLVMQTPDDLGSSMRNPRFSQGSQLQDLMAGLVLPAEDLAYATGLAREMWQEEAAAADGGAAEEPAEPAENGAAGEGGAGAGG